MPDVLSPESDPSFPSFALISIMRPMRWSPYLSCTHWEPLANIRELVPPALRKLTYHSPTERHSRAPASPLFRPSDPWITMVMSMPDPCFNAYCFPYPLVSISPLIITNVHIDSYFRFTGSQVQYHLTLTMLLQILQQRVQASEASGPQRSPARRAAVWRPEEHSMEQHKEPWTRTQLAVSSSPGSAIVPAA